MNEIGRSPLIIIRLASAILLPIYLLILMPLLTVTEAQTINSFAGITTNMPPQAPVIQKQIVQAKALLATPLVIPSNPNPPPYVNSGDI